MLLLRVSSKIRYKFKRATLGFSGYSDHQIGQQVLHIRPLALPMAVCTKFNAFPSEKIYIFSTFSLHSKQQYCIQ